MHRLNKGFIQALALILLASVGVVFFTFSKLHSIKDDPMKAAGGPYCKDICADNGSCRINGCKVADGSTGVEMVRYHCDTISPNGCPGPEVGRGGVNSMSFQENCGSEQIDAYLNGVPSGWAHIDYSQDCTSPPPADTPTPTPTVKPTPTPVPTPTPTATPTVTPSPTATPISSATPTPTPTVTPTATPTNPPGEPNSCNGTCGSNNNCRSGYFCHNGFCRNPSCADESDCSCPLSVSTSTPPPVLGATAPPALPKTGGGIEALLSLLGIGGFGIYLARRYRLV